MPLLTSRSLNERRRFQFVRFLADALPVGFSFMLFCPPCRNNPALGLGDLGVDCRDLKIVHNSNGVNSNLAVVIRKSRLHPRTLFHDARGYADSFLDPNRSASPYIYIMYSWGIGLFRHMGYNV